MINVLSVLKVEYWILFQENVNVRGDIKKLILMIVLNVFPFKGNVSLLVLVIPN